jgi:hypothetical protein
MQNITGGCLCEKVQISVAGKPLRVGICHCLDCRKHHGALFHASAIFPQNAVTTTGDLSEFQGRHFCSTCGSSVFSTSESEIEVHLGVLDKIDQFIPTYELWTDRREQWLPRFDVSKRHKRDATDEDT